MTLRTLTSFALQGLWRQKVRTTLTLVGVMVGTCALAFSLALGFGLRTFIDHQFKGRDDFWRVVVSPSLAPGAANSAPGGGAGRLWQNRRLRTASPRSTGLVRCTGECAASQPPSDSTPRRWREANEMAANEPSAGTDGGGSLE